MRPISPSFPITHQSPNILQYFVKIKRQNIHSILRILDSVKPYHPICFASILYADPRLFQSYHPIFHPDIHSLLHIHKSFKQIAQYFFLAIIHFWKYLGVPKLSIFVLERNWKEPRVASAVSLRSNRTNKRSDLRQTRPQDSLAGL